MTTDPESVGIPADERSLIEALAPAGLHPAALGLPAPADLTADVFREALAQYQEREIVREAERITLAAVSPPGFDDELRRTFSVPAKSARGTAVAVDLADLWDERPILRHVHDFARARRVAPLAVFGVVLMRVIAATPPGLRTPDVGRGPGTLNHFLALVGRSGDGKGVAMRAAADAVLIEGVESFKAGSGEGLVKLYVAREKAETVRLRDAVMIDVPEVDSLAALGSRQGATLLPELRSAWSGESLGHAYADPSKAVRVDADTYRLSAVVGVQPGRAAALLDDSDGGTPQRFLWLPVVDPQMPRERTRAPEPLSWSVPWWSGRDVGQRHEMTLPEAVADAVDEAGWLIARGDADALDGHALYARVKVAAALALLDGRVDVSDGDWRIAGRLMAVSDATRADVVRQLRERGTESNLARARADAAREVVKVEAVEAEAVKRAASSVRGALGKIDRGTWIAGAELRRSLRSDVRKHFEAAVEALTLSGDVEAMDSPADGGARGVRYRLAG